MGFNPHVSDPDWWCFSFKNVDREVGPKATDELYDLIESKANAELAQRQAEESKNEKAENGDNNKKYGSGGIQVKHEANNMGLQPPPPHTQGQEGSAAE